MISTPIIYIMFSMLASIFGIGVGDEFLGLGHRAVVEDAVSQNGQGAYLEGAGMSGDTEDHTVEANKVLIAEMLDGILTDSRLDGALTGVSIRHAGSGELLYTHMGDIRLHPASNMKLLTAAAALEVLGEDYRFTTEVWSDGDIVNGVLTGNLYLKGKGDPTLMQEDLTRLAKDLKEKGIKRIEGHLVGDDSWYDDIRLSRDMDWSDEPYYYGAQVSALTLSPNTDYDAGSVIVEVRPASSSGRQAEVTLAPATDYITVVNRTQTVSRNGANTIKLDREHGTNRIIVEGTIPVGGSVIREWMSVWEPTGYAMDVFRQSLSAEGITTSNVISPEPLTGVVPADATLLTSKQSIPLSELIIPFMKLSNNLHGEHLTKEMGRVIYGEGSWEQGLQVIKDTVASLGVDTSTIMLRDGSGISHLTMIPADELSKLLYTIQSREWYPLYERSLPVAGAADRIEGGSLRWRLIGTAAQGNVRAKTGSLSTVSTLSGYVTTRDGEKLIFSILINNYLVTSVRAIEDEIVKALAGMRLG